jgi:hypothetical protein
MPAGRPLEPAGDGRPRWMTAGRDAARRPVHRIRLIGQLVRPKVCGRSRWATAVAASFLVTHSTGRTGLIVLSCVAFLVAVIFTVIGAAGVQAAESPPHFRLRLHPRPFRRRRDHVKLSVHRHPTHRQQTLGRDENERELPDTSFPSLPSVPSIARSATVRQRSPWKNHPGSPPFTPGCTRLRVLRIYPSPNQKIATQFVEFILGRFLKHSR